MGGLSMAEDRASILDVQQEWVNGSLVNGVTHTRVVRTALFNVVGALMALASMTHTQFSNLLPIYLNNCICITTRYLSFV